MNCCDNCGNTYDTCKCGQMSDRTTNIPWHYEYVEASDRAIRLERERDKWMDRTTNALATVGNLTAERDELRAEVERLKADKKEMELLIETARQHGGSLALHSAQEEIDAAMKGDK